jgi:hypothetical protein
MAGLVPAIHVLLAVAQQKKDVDARHKAGHDESESDAAGRRRDVDARTYGDDGA